MLFLTIAKDNKKRGQKMPWQWSNMTTELLKKAFSDINKSLEDHLNEIKINHFFAQWRAKSAKKSNIREIQ